MGSDNTDAVDAMVSAVNGQSGAGRAWESIGAPLDDGVMTILPKYDRAYDLHLSPASWDKRKEVGSDDVGDVRWGNIAKGAARLKGLHDATKDLSGLITTKMAEIDGQWHGDSYEKFKEYIKNVTDTLDRYSAAARLAYASLMAGVDTYGSLQPLYASYTAASKSHFQAVSAYPDDPTGDDYDAYYYDVREAVHAWYVDTDTLKDDIKQTYDAILKDLRALADAKVFEHMVVTGLSTTDQPANTPNKDNNTGTPSGGGTPSSGGGTPTNTTASNATTTDTPATTTTPKTTDQTTNSSTTSQGTNDLASMLKQATQSSSGTPSKTATSGMASPHEDVTIKDGDEKIKVGSPDEKGRYKVTLGKPPKDYTLDFKPKSKDGTAGGPDAKRGYLDPVTGKFVEDPEGMDADGVIHAGADGKIVLHDGDKSYTFSKDAGAANGVQLTTESPGKEPHTYSVEFSGTGTASGLGDATKFGGLSDLASLSSTGLGDLTGGASVGTGSSGHHLGGGGGGGGAGIGASTASAFGSGQDGQHSGTSDQQHVGSGQASGQIAARLGGGFGPQGSGAAAGQPAAGMAQSGMGGGGMGRGAGGGHGGGGDTERGPSKYRVPDKSLFESDDRVLPNRAIGED
ncbi:hypothetical protein F0L68_05055 [Solihabitans fulvus]|uniref:Uncharacterized protein n=1 Tax=Solihabitans fulvus TaxID=1892852 RepID=A0A5B2XQU7_9PSEU|nr:hypothetical protein [Solihabitans fulvus]KAA2265219.1 hypothetical protein F0L68_05055 [Solihabitans fulvus]